MVIGKTKDIANWKIVLHKQEANQVKQVVYLTELITDKWQMRRRNPLKNRNCKEILHQKADGNDEPQTLINV